MFNSGILLRKIQAKYVFYRSCSAYKWEVDYKEFNEAIRVTLVSYHRYIVQDASISNQSLSTTLTLQLLLYSS